EVHGHECVGLMARCVGGHAVGKCGVAVTQQDCYVRGFLVDGGQVCAAIAVEVPRHQSDRIRPDGNGTDAAECAVASAQQHGHVIGDRVGGTHVDPTVPVEVHCH